LIFTSEQSTQEECEISLEELEFFVQTVDNANDLVQIKGISPLLRGLSHPISSIRSRCAFVLGTALQDNLKVQEQVLEMNGVKLLVEALKRESQMNKSIEAMYTIGKIIYAIMALLGHNLKAQKDFRQQEGFKELLNLLKNVPKQTEEFIIESKMDKTNEIEELDSLKSDDGIPEIVELRDKVKRQAILRENKKKKWEFN